MKVLAPAHAAALQVEGAVLRFSGDLLVHTVAAVWHKAEVAVHHLAAHELTHELTIDISRCGHVDSAGATLLLSLEQMAQQAHGYEAGHEAGHDAGNYAGHDVSHGAGNGVVWRGVDEKTASLLAQLRHNSSAAPSHAVQKRAEKAEFASEPAPTSLETLKIRIAFFGDTILALLTLPGKLRFLRGADFARLADQAGYQALPLVVMLGFLIGMILAFQSAIPMRQFGADLYVADLVALSLFRELGPLLVAVILAGRTGSAFAAELGTMQVNEEIDALTTMGIDPETMLVLPRVAAAILIMPALVVAMDVAGLLGMGAVLMLFGFPPSAIIAQITFAAGAPDFLLGLFKGLAFAAAVAMIGCRAGLTAGHGPRAVGEAATAAVVGGIVATVMLDGLFAVMSYRLGL